MYTPPSSQNSSRGMATFMRPGPVPFTHTPQTSPPNGGSVWVPVPCRQIHTPKSPMYRPAVLRATDPPLRPASFTPLTGSPKSGEVEWTGSNYDAKSIASSLEEIEDVEIPWNVIEDEAEEVTGPPTKANWKHDEQAIICDLPTCIRRFNFMTRRHHCRRCGHIFCYNHASKYLPLSQTGKIHPDGKTSRVCDGCFVDFKRLKSARRSGSISSDESDSITSGPSGSLPMGVKMASRREAQQNAKVGSFLGSVPRDWSWSTF